MNSPDTAVEGIPELVARLLQLELHGWDKAIREAADALTQLQAERDEARDTLNRHINDIKFEMSQRVRAESALAACQARLEKAEEALKRIYEMAGAAGWRPEEAYALCSNIRSLIDAFLSPIEAKP